MAPQSNKKAGSKMAKPPHQMDRRVRDDGPSPEPGAEVVALVGGIYNGPGHRALPMAEPGDTIRVAEGEYLDSLLDDDLVVLADQFDESMLFREDLEALDASIAEQDQVSDPKEETPPPSTQGGGRKPKDVQPQP